MHQNKMHRMELQLRIFFISQSSFNTAIITNILDKILKKLNKINF